MSRVNWLQSILTHTDRDHEGQLALSWMLKDRPLVLRSMKVDFTLVGTAPLTPAHW